jgi:iron complex outermembrane recepter protein
MHSPHSSTITPIFLAILIAAAPVAAIAQTATVDGTVVSSLDSRPLAGATVRLIEAHRVETTHSGGGFSFTGISPGTHTIVVQRLGYTTSTRQITAAAGERSSVQFVLQPAAVELQATVVTGTVGERARDEVLSPSTVIAGSELARRLQPTLAATMEMVPGAASTSIGPSTARPVVRGLSGDRVLVLEDGQRTGDLSAMSGDHAQAVETASAERIEVVRGPMSLLYGSSAMGGVINVIRREIPTYVPEHTHGALTAQASSVNAGGALAADATFPLGASAALRSEGAFRGGGDYRTPLGTLQNTGSRALSAGVGLGLLRGSSHYGGAYRFYDSRYGIPGGYVGGHEEGVDIETRRHTARAEAEWHDLTNRELDLRATGFFSDYSHFEFESGGEVGTLFYQTIGGLESVVRHEQLGPFSLGAIGVRAQYRDIITGGSLRTPSTYDYGAAAYAVEEIARGPLRIQGGLRFDYARYVPRDLDAFVLIGGERVNVRPRSFAALTGSVGGLYELFDGVRIGTSVSRAFRTPDFNELYSNGPHLAANTYDVGDPELEEETGTGVDAFIRYNRGRVRFELAAFRNALDNYIFPSTRGRVEAGRVGSRARAQYTNEGALFRGWEADFEWLPFGSWVVDGAMSEVRARFTTERSPIPVFNEDGTTSFVEPSRFPPLIPPRHGHVGVGYQGRSWTARAQTRMAAAQNRLSEFETRTPGYSLFDLSLGYRFLGGTRLHSLTLRIDNLTDRAWRNHLSRIKDLFPEPGRDVSLVYRLTF